MTSEASADGKEVIFVNHSAARDYRALPGAVKEMADARTTILQNGGRLPSKQHKALSGMLAGISEIRIFHDDNTYRVYFAAEYAEVVYILDAGLKKSPHDGEISQSQIDRLLVRKNAADAHYKQHRQMLESRAAARQRAREAKSVEQLSVKRWRQEGV